MFYKFSLLALILSVSHVQSDEKREGQGPSHLKIKSLYNGLNPTSIPEHLAFYELYKQYPQGKIALCDAYKLLMKTSCEPLPSQETLLPLLENNRFLLSINSLIGLIVEGRQGDGPNLSEEDLLLISSLAKELPNRERKGHYVVSEKEMLNLPPSEIDLARGLLLSQLQGEKTALSKIKHYEAILDLMALQILTQVSLKDSAEKKIAAINHFIFVEMGFRFPPHSSYSKEIDLYTFLPSVIDSRRGVCLGVSILYLCLAERLALNLEVIIPPGHIFVRYADKDKHINIETTARGVHFDDDKYLGIDLKSLPQCNVKETIGMAHFNQASVYWKLEQYDKVITSYQRAKPYLGNDPLMSTLLGFALVLNDDEIEGKKLLEEIVHKKSPHAVSKDTMAEDYLNGDIDSVGIKNYFLHVDETRESLLQKKVALEKSLQKYPRYREGLFSLAATWLQLQRNKEALYILNDYHAIDQTNPTVEYYLAALYQERLDYNKAWEHLQLAEKITKEQNHFPKALKELRQELIQHCPE